MSQVVPMASRDLPQFDGSAACELQAIMGAERFRSIIEQSVFQMIDKVCLLEHAIEDEEFNEARLIARRLSAMGAHVGLEEFAEVASNLETCCEVEDPTAIAAVKSRLVRISENCFFSLLQMADRG